MRSVSVASRRVPIHPSGRRARATAVTFALIAGVSSSARVALAQIPVGPPAPPIPATQPPVAQPPVVDSSVVAPAAVVPTTAAAKRSVIRLTASLAERRLHIYDGDSTLTYDVAVGTNNKPTPTGTFRIRKIVWNPAWVPPAEKWARGKESQAPGAQRNPMKLVKIFFQEPDYYIHGTGDVESLGSAASHGCLRMHPDDAYRVARYVMEHGGQMRDEGWFQRVLHFRSESKTVYLDTPITLVITN